MGTGEGEVGAGFSVDLFHHLQALCRFQVGQDEGGRFGEGGAYSIDDLFGAVWVDGDDGAGGLAWLKGHGWHGGNFVSIFGG